MATSTPTNDPRTETADEPKVKGLSEPEDARELTPEEEEKIVGGMPPNNMPVAVNPHPVPHPH